MPPRASNAAKRQQNAANQRDTRHENGLVGPGKRVHRQRSNGYIKGHAKPSDNLSSAQLTATTFPSGDEHVRQPACTDSMVEYKLFMDSMRRQSNSGLSESSSSGYGTPTIGSLPETHRQIDVNATKNPAVHRDAGPIGLAFTVLRSCPLYDTIAILIVLLQIPPAFLSIIHFLFASLTFVPSSASAISGLSFTDIFEGTIGTPSIATIVVVDLIVLLVWLFLWIPLQDIALDLAQTVIALTLGGGTSGREAGMNNVIICFGIIGVSHLARNEGVKQTGLRAILSTSGGWLGSAELDDPFEPMVSRMQKRTAPGWIRSILAIHILTQGAVRYIRDWYVRREKRDVPGSAGDPEAAKGSLTDSTIESSTPTLQTPDNETPTPLPLGNSTSASKKKKKQSALVRIRQPLWAALASTKIVMVKEYESSHIAAESAGANATDINNLGNAPFSTESNRIWISYIGSDEVSFSTSHFPTHTSERWEGSNSDSPSIDKSKPFYVNVNSTVWQPTRIIPNSDEHSIHATQWSVEVFGLAPMSNYYIEFLSTSTGDIIFSTSVRTLQPPVLTNMSPNPAVTGRPGSPTTTLKSSIASSEIRLVEERARLKRDRKEQRTKISSLRREIDKLLTTLANSGGTDDRLRQKVYQSQLHMKQADDALSVLSTEIDDLDKSSSCSSASVLPAWKSQRALFSHTKEMHKSSHRDSTNAKTTAEQSLSSLSSELSSLQQKSERRQARITKLQSEYERISDANARGLDEATRRAVRNAEHARTETLYLERLQASSAQIAEAMSALQEVYASIEGLQHYEQIAVQQQTAHSPSNNQSFFPGYAEATGESSHGVMPSSASYAWFTPSVSHSLPQPSGTNPTTGSTSGPSGPSPLAPWLGPGAQNASQSLGQSQGAVSAQSQIRHTRARSSSMLSTVSGFTQTSGEHMGHQPAGSNDSESGFWDAGTRHDFGAVGEGLGVSMGSAGKAGRKRSDSGGTRKNPGGRA